MIILTLTQKDKLSENLVNIMTEIEDEILHKIAKQLAADNNISDTSKWRIRQLARSGQLKRESLELIKSYSGIQSESLYDALQTAALEEVSNVDRAAREAIKNGLLNGSTDIPADKTAENALKAYYKQAKSDLNMVNTVMGYQASQAFVNAVNDVYGYVHKQLDKGTAKVVTGSESLQTAIRETIKDLSKHGIPAFVDKRGHHWSPESYVRMDLRTTLGNTANAAQWSRCDQFGISLISVDSHSGSRPLCAPYQGRIFSRDGTFGVTSDGSGKRIEYSPLSSTSYGKPAGLFGINCGHSSYPFIPGINIQRYFPVDPEENAARYKELQKQRQLEREIRAGKRECMMLQAAGDEEGYKKAALRLRTKREQYKVYSNAHDLSLHNDRTQVYGFDRSKSMKTVWAEKKLLTWGNGDAIIGLKIQQFKTDLANGKVNTTIDKSQQNKHTYSKVWKNQVKQAMASNGKEAPKSVLSKKLDPQNLIDKYAGKGNDYRFIGNNKYPDEYITLPFVVGKTYDKKTGKYSDTHRIQLKYNEKKGAHIFPINEKGAN